MMKRLFFCILPILLIGCAPQPIGPLPTPIPASEAEQRLIKFFNLLNAKEYADADALYGGSYDQLQVFNPDIDPADHASLWKNACETSGLQCLKVRTAALINEQNDIFIFQVEFNNPNGTLFVLGPCCGSDATDMPPVHQFEYRMRRNASGQLVVMDLPPYVP